MTEQRIDHELRLIPYYRNDAVSLPWYQDPDVCKQVDDRDAPYDLELLHRMYDYLSSQGEIAIVVCKEFQNRHIGRRCVLELLQLAREKGLARVRANIYAFNGQSQRMFRSAGFRKIDAEWYEYVLQEEP